MLVGFNGTRVRYWEWCTTHRTALSADHVDENKLLVSGGMGDESASEQMGH